LTFRTPDCENSYKRIIRKQAANDSANDSWIGGNQSPKRHDDQGSRTADAVGGNAQGNLAASIQPGRTLSPRRRWA